MTPPTPRRKATRAKTAKVETRKMRPGEAFFDDEASYQHRQGVRRLSRETMKPASKAKTAKRFVLRVNMRLGLDYTRSKAKDTLQDALNEWMQKYPLGVIKSARVTNADIP